ncbi:MAG: hypothetical protein GF401_20400 [Chitinivibrionales bacterium]|nr:hypothetical protein [Chitinivibrionales bacterium]
MHHNKFVLFLSAFLLALFAGFFVYYPLTNTDIWWHLASAREMLSQKSLFFADPFSFTPHETPWINIHWLFQFLVYGIYSFLGIQGLALFRSMVFAGACVLLFFAFPQKKNPVLYAFIIALMFFWMRYLVLVRPILVTLFCMALFIFCLEHFYALKKYRYLYVLLPVQILWTNCQGLFVLGPIILGAYWVGGTVIPALFLKNDFAHRKELLKTGLIAAAVTLSTVINPYGLSGMFYPLRLFKRIDPALGKLYAENVSENTPLSQLFNEGSLYAAFVVAVFLITLVVLVLNRKKIRIAHLLLFAAFSYLAYTSKRNILLFAFITAPVLGYSGGYLLERAGQAIRRFMAAVGLSLGGVITVALVFLHALVLRVGPSQQFLSPFRYPDDAVAYLHEYPVTGHIFNSVRYGGYLLWELYPPKKVFIDGRLIIRTPEFYAEYLAILDNPDLFARVADKFSITHVLVPTAIFDRYMKLFGYLYENGAWRLVFADGSSALFVKDSYAQTPPIDLESRKDIQMIENRIERKWKNKPYLFKEARGHLVNLIKTIRGGEFSKSK